MAVELVKTELKDLCDDGKIPTVKDGKIEDPSPGTDALDLKSNFALGSDDGVKKAKLSGYIAANSMIYAKQGQIITVSNSDRGSSATDAVIPQEAKNIWWKIARQIANDMHVARNGKAIPKGKGALTFNNVPLAAAGIPAFGQGSGGEPLVTIDSKKPEAIGKAIYQWFEDNYIEACKAGTKADVSTEPKGKTDKIDNAFNDYWKKATFDGPKVPVPAALKPASGTPKPEYVTGCIAHKDYPNTQGYVMGPFERTIVMIEKDEDIELKDGAAKQKVKKYEESETAEGPLDENEFILDSQQYQDQIEKKTNYETFKKNRGPEYTGLPIDGGKELEIPKRNDDGEIIPGADPVKLGVFGLTKDGLLGDAKTKDDTPKKSGGKAGAKNDNYNKPTPIPDYGAPIFDDSLPVSKWKDANGNAIIFSAGKNRSKAWGGDALDSKGKYSAKGDPPNGDDPVKNYSNQTKVVKDGDPGDGLSWSDPRTWGEWKQQDRKGSDEDKDYWKTYLIPSKLGEAIGQANASSGRPESLALPKLNRQYWGLRIEELFPDKSPEDAFAAAAGSEGLPNSGALKDGAIYIAGPAPPLKIAEKGSSFSFKWKKEVLFKNGKVGRSDGEAFDRGGANSNPISTYNTIGKFLNGTDGVVAKLDDQCKGEARGGMIFADPGKQILFPYTPPTGLKPFQPNSKTYKF